MTDIKEMLMGLLDAMFKGGSCVDKEDAADFLITSGVTVQEWISVRERLPEKDTRVLVWIGENNCNFPTIDTDR